MSMGSILPLGCQKESKQKDINVPQFKLEFSIKKGEEKKVKEKALAFEIGAFVKFSIVAYKANLS